MPRKDRIVFASINTINNAQAFNLEEFTTKIVARTNEEVLAALKDMVAQSSKLGPIILFVEENEHQYD